MPNTKLSTNVDREEFNYAEALGKPRPKLMLCDISSSMLERVRGIPKIEMLREACEGILDSRPRRVIAFGSEAEEVPDATQLPTPRGSTALHIALELAATMTPDHTLVISDGQPDNAELAFEAARKVRGIIDTLFIGPETDYRAKQFLRDLAYRNRGRPVTQDMSKGVAALSSTIQGLLGA